MDNDGELPSSRRLPSVGSHNNASASAAAGSGSTTPGSAASSRPPSASPSLAPRAGSNASSTGGLVPIIHSSSTSPNNNGQAHSSSSSSSSSSTGGGIALAELSSPLLSPRGRPAPSSRRAGVVKEIDYMETVDFTDDLTSHATTELLGPTLAALSTRVPAPADLLPRLGVASSVSSSGPVSGAEAVYGCQPARRDVDPHLPGTKHVVDVLIRDFDEAFGPKFLGNNPSLRPPVSSAIVNNTSSSFQTGGGGGVNSAASRSVSAAATPSASPAFSPSPAPALGGLVADNTTPIPPSFSTDNLAAINNNNNGSSSGSGGNGGLGSGGIGAGSMETTFDEERIARAHTYAQVSFLESVWPQFARFFICLIIGVAVSCLGLAVEFGVRGLYTTLIAAITFFMQRNGGVKGFSSGLHWLWPVAAMIVGVFITLVLGAALVVVSFMGGYYPIRGSGIPHLAAYLDGSFNTSLPIFTMKVLAAKTVSLIFALGANLKSGLQGPLIHMGGLIARQVTTLLVRVVASPATARVVRALCCCLINKHQRCRRNPCLGPPRAAAGPLARRAAALWFAFERRFSLSPLVLVPAQDGSEGWDVVDRRRHSNRGGRNSNNNGPVPAAAAGYSRHSGREELDLDDSAQSDVGVLTPGGSVVGHNDGLGGTGMGLGGSDVGVGFGQVRRGIVVLYLKILRFLI